MPRVPAAPLVLVLGAFAAFLLAACGEEDAQLLPGGTAREITANLDSVQDLADEGDCAGAEGATRQVSEQIEALEGVDVKLKRALEEGAARLNEVVAECDEAATEATEPATVPPEDETGDEKEPKEKDKKTKEEDEGEGSEGPGQAPPDTPSSSPPPPHAEGKGNGPDGEDESDDDEGGEEGSSGGISPGSPAGEGE